MESSQNLGTILEAVVLVYCWGGFVLKAVELAMT
jgi:hypothetical protein